VRSKTLRLSFLAAALALASPAAPATGPIRPVGSELQVNMFTETREWRTATAASDAGFVVVWESRPSHDGDASGVFARRFASTGAGLGVEFQVNTYTTGNEDYADVAMNAAGDFVVVWQRSGASYFTSYGLFAQRFASDGTERGVEFQVNTLTGRDERDGSVAMDASGNFVVAWTSSSGDGSSDAVIAQRFDSTGAKVGGEFLVNTFTTNTQGHPRVAMTAGNFVVVWQSFTQDDGFDWGIFGRRFASSGAALGVEFQVNQQTVLTQIRPDVALRADGGFVVVWDSFQGLDFRDVVGRRFDSTGAAQGAEFVADTHTIDDQRSPSVAIDGTGKFVVAWTSHYDDMSGDDVFARVYDSTGVPQGLDFRVNAFRVNAFTFSRQDHPVVAALGDGRFVVAWESTNGDDGDYDVFARRLTPPATLDVDANGSVAPLTDGLLVLRHLFGFSGTTLTGGAVGAGCNRCDATAIGDYLGSLGLVLDADGNSSVGALTDGLLILRFVFGFTGSTLSTGAVAGNCTRCTGEDIVAYLQPLLSV
jgi:hypothetical protein